MIGVPSSMRAKGPCFKDPPGYPSACKYVISFIFKAASFAIASPNPFPKIKQWSLLHKDSEISLHLLWVDSDDNKVWQ